MYDKITRETMVRTYFGCEMGDIAKTAVLTPIWSLEGFKAASEAVEKEFAGWYKGITLVYEGQRITVISSGIGSPMTGDCALALGYTDCENVIFSGSAGAINAGYNIGDLLAVKEAVIGEGFSRYHRGDLNKDCFGELSQGDAGLAGVLKEVMKQHAPDLNTVCHEGRIFSTDSILGETKEAFDFMVLKGCDAVEMEVSAVFTACRKIGKKAAAFIIISDVPLKERSLFEGITESDVERYNKVKGALPKMILEAAARAYNIRGCEK